MQLNKLPIAIGAVVFGLAASHAMGIGDGPVVTEHLDQAEIDAQKKAKADASKANQKKGRK